MEEGGKRKKAGEPASTMDVLVELRGEGRAYAGKRGLGIAV